MIVKNSLWAGQARPVRAGHVCPFPAPFWPNFRLIFVQAQPAGLKFLLQALYFHAWDGPGSAGYPSQQAQLTASAYKSANKILLFFIQW